MYKNMPCCTIGQMLAFTSRRYVPRHGFGDGRNQICISGGSAEMNVSNYWHTGGHYKRRALFVSPSAGGFPDDVIFLNASKFDRQSLDILGYIFKLNFQIVRIHFLHLTFIYEEEPVSLRGAFSSKFLTPPVTHGEQMWGIGGGAVSVFRHRESSVVSRKSSSKCSWKKSHPKL